MGFLAWLRAPRGRGGGGRQCGRPQGHPHRKDYHKKQRITFRWPAVLVGEFKAECRLHGVACSDVTEFMAWDMLRKHHIAVLKKKIVVDE